MSNKTVDLVLKRFPDKKNLIKKLYKNSEEFREVCANYKEIMDTWSKSQIVYENPRIEEYQILLNDLEADITSYFLE